jgi:hypothetical protein
MESGSINEIGGQGDKEVGRVSKAIEVTDSRRRVFSDELGRRIRDRVVSYGRVLGEEGERLVGVVKDFVVGNLDAFFPRSDEIGRRVDRPLITGGEGEELSITLGGIDLRQYLPKNYRILGERLTEKNNAGPRFEVGVRVVVLPITKDKGEVAETIKEREDAGLVILHEIGHAIDEEETHSHLREIEAGIVVEAVPYGLDEFGEEMSSCVQGIVDGVFDEGMVQRLNKVVAGAVKQRVEDSFEFFQPFGILGSDADIFSGLSISRREVFQSYGEDTDDVKRRVVKEVADGVLNRVMGLTNEGGFSGSFIALVGEINDQLKLCRVDCEERMRKFKRDNGARCERQAWAKGLQIARNLIRERSVRLWKGSGEEGLQNLFDTIDSYVYYHKGLSRDVIRRKRGRRMIPTKLFEHSEELVLD